MYKYKIVTKDENDTQATVISKTGLVAEFSLKQVYDHKLKVEQEIQEKKSTIELAKAKQANIEENHKDIKKIIDSIKKEENSNGIFATLFLWIKEDIEIDNNTKMVEEREALIKNYEEELDNIHKALDIPKPIKISYTKANKKDNE